MNIKKTVKGGLEGLVTLAVLATPFVGALALDNVKTGNLLYSKEITLSDEQRILGANLFTVAAGLLVDPKVTLLVYENENRIVGDTTFHAIGCYDLDKDGVLDKVESRVWPSRGGTAINAAQEILRRKNNIDPTSTFQFQLCQEVYEQNYKVSKE